MDAEKRDPQTYNIIGAAMEVYQHLGNGFLEQVYQEALAKEFTKRDIPFQKEVQLTVFYKGEPLNCTYRADFVCYENIIVELKALDNLSGNEESQIIHYLKVTGFQRGLLINFGAPAIQFKRFVYNSLR
jgi:GxxExxY protein